MIKITVRRTRRRDPLSCARDILHSRGMQLEKRFMQHGRVSCFEHSLRVARLSALLAHLLPGRFRMRSLVRGALLHDYFLYDWHAEDGGAHRGHGFTHAARALANARRDFRLNKIERDIIEKHMFPLNPAPPKYPESWIVTLSDKLCAGAEVLAAWRERLFGRAHRENPGADV